MCVDCHITRHELCWPLSVDKGSVVTVIDELGYSMFCARLVAQMLTDAHTKTRRAITTDLSHQYNNGDEGFL
jgi:hypothetical protein